MTDEEHIERSFLCKVLLKRGASRRLDQNFVEVKAKGASAKMFSIPECKVIWMATEDMFASRDPGKVSVSDIISRAKQIVRSSSDREISGSKPEMSYLDYDQVGFDRNDDVDGYYRRLRDAYACREVTALYQKTIEAFKSGDDALVAVAKMQSGCDAIIKDTQVDEDGPSIRRDGRKILEKYRETYHHKQELGETDYVDGLPLAWKDLTKTLGGLGNTMTTIAARTGIGKTSFGVALIRYWLRTGKKVVFNSIDMESMELMRRQFSEGSLVSERSMRNGDIGPQMFEFSYKKTEEDYEELAHYEDIGQYKILEERDVDVLASKVRILKNQGRIDVLVVDYVQLLECKGARNMVDRVNYAADTLMKIANQVKIPVITLAQINRNPMKEGEEPELHDLKGSGKIEEDSANVLILMQNTKLCKQWEETPPAQFLKNPNYPPPPRAIMPMWVKVAKARSGGNGVRFPFVVLQGKYSWYLGDRTASEDEMFSRVHLNQWKRDPLEQVWMNNGAVIDDNLQQQIDAINERSRI